jgi:hypothetical protein
LLALSPWAVWLRARTLQLSEGKWSFGVEFGVKQREGLAVAYSSQYKLAGARPIAVHRRGSRVVKNRKGKGLFAIVSGTEKQYCRLFKDFSNHQGPLCKSDAAGTRGGAFCRYWAGSGWIEPSTVDLFSFSFATRLWKSIENSRKVLKMWDQFCWTPKLL